MFYAHLFKLAFFKRLLACAIDACRASDFEGSEYSGTSGKTLLTSSPIRADMPFAILWLEVRRAATFITLEGEQLIAEAAVDQLNPFSIRDSCIDV